MAHSKDHLDYMLDQWRRERPEIDADGMAIVPRLMRLAHLYESRMRSVSRGLGLKPGWLDALSALRRIGPPYRLTASELAQSILLSSGGMTSRIDRMEEAGLTKRVPHPSDRRVVFVELTERGRKTIDAAIDAHLDLCEDLLSSLTKTEQKTFIDLMRKQTLALEPEPA
jgi:DNA-binding MarR family transcriptional regulator